MYKRVEYYKGGVVLDKRVLNFLVIFFLSVITFLWTFSIFHFEVDYKVIAIVIVVRMIVSRIMLRDYSLSWSKASQKTFLIKSFVYVTAFLIYMPYFYGDISISFFISELFLYIFSINFLMYTYYYLVNRSRIEKTKSVVIYGAGRAGLKLASEFSDSEYRVKYFVDDDTVIQNRSIDSVEVVSRDTLLKDNKTKFDLLVIAMPSAQTERVKEIYEELNDYFTEIRVLPSLNEILYEKEFFKQLKNISVEDLLARHPKDLDKDKIAEFITGKVVLVTGAGGSIGSEICRQCEKYGAKKLLLLDHSEFNLYSIEQEIKNIPTVAIMENVRDFDLIEHTFAKYRPEIVIHAAAYKHVPLVEYNITEAVLNNVAGTKNVIDISIQYGVEKFVLISTDKAVRPTNVMGATKRICELYAQNVDGKQTEIVAVRFGNVLGSSGSVIPKFQAQIEKGGPLTVTHPEITRYFMLIPEACELVLQAAAIGNGGEVFILDMGEPIKIVNLAQKMIELSGKDNVKIEFTGLRPGEKLYEELLIDKSDMQTKYQSIMVAQPTKYNLEKLQKDIEELLESSEKLQKIKEIVPEFHHQLN